MTRERVNIAVVDDHPIFREGVIRVLRAEPAFEVVAQGTCAADAVEIAISNRPDIMILDISMPGDGLEAARSVLETAPDIKVLMLTVVDDDNLVVSAMRAGAKGYVLKGASSRELIDALWSMHKGQSFISPDLAANILERMSQANFLIQRRDGVELGDGHVQILSLLAKGQSYRQIELTLSIDSREIDRMLGQILTMLRIERRKIRSSGGFLH